MMHGAAGLTKPAPHDAAPTRAWEDPPYTTAAARREAAMC